MTQQSCVWTGTAVRQENATPAREPIGEQGGPDQNAGTCPNARVAPSGSVTPLRVAVLAPVSWRVPPRHYGPWEQFASLLTEGLVDRGIEVTLFATADSVTGAQLASVVPQGYS